jgi:hypothetical protein
MGSCELWEDEDHSAEVLIESEVESKVDMVPWWLVGVVG